MRHCGGVYERLIALCGDENVLCGIMLEDEHIEKLSVTIHTGHANTMTFGTPQQVRNLVKWEYDVFRVGDGGSWFFAEMDNGFPAQSVQAHVETIAQ